MGGYSYQEFDYEHFGAENRNFPTEVFNVWNLDAGDYNKVQGRNGMWSGKSQEKTIAFLGRLNYNWKDFLLFTGSLRYEGNSKFGVDHKWGLFPAASAAVRISKLPALMGNENINDLKLRFSYGETGGRALTDIFRWLNTLAMELIGVTHLANSSKVMVLATTLTQICSGKNKFLTT